MTYFLITIVFIQFTDDDRHRYLRLHCRSCAIVFRFISDFINYTFNKDYIWKIKIGFRLMCSNEYMDMDTKGTCLMFIVHHTLWYSIYIHNVLTVSLIYWLTKLLCNQQHHVSCTNTNVIYLDEKCSKKTIKTYTL